MALSNRRSFLKNVVKPAALVPLSLAARGLLPAMSASAAVGPIQRVGGPRVKLALNAYSFSKRLNDHLKGRGNGVSLVQLVDFCALHDLDGLDPTGYFFPGYPQPPADDFVNQLKRRAFDAGIGISGTGVRNNFTTAEKAVRMEGVQHIKQWVEVAARLGAPVLRVFADTQIKSQAWQTVAPGCTRDNVEEWIADAVRECAEHGEEFGVIVGVQNHGDFLKTSTDHLSLIKRVDSDWCGPIVDTGYYKSDDPYLDMAAVAPYAVNWQIKESPFGVESEVRTDSKKLLSIIRLAGYRGYLPIETLSAPGKDYDPLVTVPRFLAELRKAMEATASIVPPQAAGERAAPVNPKDSSTPKNQGGKKKSGPPPADR